MPTISLRLTDEEHEQLKTWAHDGRRSVQKEMIFRLFSEPSASATMSHLPPVVADAPAPSYFPEREFKPDPKPERKK